MFKLVLLFSTYLSSIAIAMPIQKVMVCAETLTRRSVGSKRLLRKFVTDDKMKRVQEIWQGQWLRLGSNSNGIYVNLSSLKYFDSPRFSQEPEGTDNPLVRIEDVPYLRNVRTPSGRVSVLWPMRIGDGHQPLLIRRGEQLVQLNINGQPLTGTGAVGTWRFRADERVLAFSAFHAREIILFNTHTGESVHQLTAPGDVVAIDWSDVDGKSLILSVIDKGHLEIVSYDPSTRQFEKYFTYPANVTASDVSVKTLARLRKLLLAIRISPKRSEIYLLDQRYAGGQLVHLMGGVKGTAIAPQAPLGLAYGENEALVFSAESLGNADYLPIREGDGSVVYAGFNLRGQVVVLQSDGLLRLFDIKF